jgi:hypothetical protein
MELQNQAIRIKDAINVVIDALLNKSFRFDDSGQTLAMIKCSIPYMQKKLWPQGVSSERIVDYIVYQLYRRRTQTMFRFTTRDLFSDHAIQKYYDQFIGKNARVGMNYYIDLWLKDGGLSRKKLTEIIDGGRPDPLQKYVYMESEETTKTRFYNTDNGYYLCQQATTGYAPLSRACQGCDFRKRCYDVTEKKYPELMKLRIKNYEENGKK